MRKINKMDVARLVLVLMLVAGIGLAFGAVGRFVPTHKITQAVYCGSCHPEQVVELSGTTHIGKFADEIGSLLAEGSFATEYAARTPEALTNARLVSMGCVLCHNTWENMKWFGVTNFDLQAYDLENPEPVVDIYGNEVSSYGLGSTKEWLMKADYNSTSKMSAVPWNGGLDEWGYTAGGKTYRRLDYVWSMLSAVSPGPVGSNLLDPRFPSPSTYNGTSCGGGGTVEHGLCHIYSSAAVLSLLNLKNEVMDYPNGTRSFTMKGTSKRSGRGIYFTHEMAFTTAQYAAKPVKICGACHVMKLPPMQWGGEPWAISDIKFASDVANEGTVNDGPFAFRPDYNSLVGISGGTMAFEGSERGVNSTVEFPVAFRTADWAHANVPCIRCHVHAGINGETVTNAGDYHDTRIVVPATGELIPPP